MVRSSRVDQPPVSGVPVAGATLVLLAAVRGVGYRRQECKGLREGRKGEEERTSWVQRVNINTQIHGVLSPNSIPDLLDDPRHADGVNLSCLGDLESAVPVVLVVAETGERGADAGVDVGVVGEETLFVGVVEVGAVVDGRLLGRGTTEDFGPPSVAKYSQSLVSKSREG